MDQEQAIPDLPWRRGSRFGSRTVRRLLGLPLDAVTLVSELLVSRRGLGVGFLLVALAMTRAGWLRPPLTVDISAWHLPAGVLRAEGPSSEEILNGTCRTVHDSLGLLLSLLLIGEAAAVAWRPEYLGVAAWLPLRASPAGEAAAAPNHPGL